VTEPTIEMIEKEPVMDSMAATLDCHALTLAAIRTRVAQRRWPAVRRELIAADVRPALHPRPDATAHFLDTRYFDVERWDGLS
jgi:hypothetical protein